ncbi:MAG: RidA family protein [Dehalococcoidia bacterium]|nr:RidA family protein [Dehalococcoidia bacterium]
MANSPFYHHAIKKSGTPVFISGQVAEDADGKLVGEGDAGAQARQVLANLRRVVEAAGGTMGDIVKITVFTTSLEYRPAIVEARNSAFTAGEMPASTFVVVSSLAAPGYLVEIEAVAVV